VSVRGIISVAVSAITTSLVLVQAQAQPLSQGQVVFVRECAKCHQIGPDAKNRIGPHLNGLFGRKAGSVEGFKNYSEANRTANFVWTEDLLRQYIKDPKGMMIGTTQVYRGLLNDADIDALIVYLRENGK
jgi:cytochrome c